MKKNRKNELCKALLCAALTAAVIASAGCTKKNDESEVSSAPVATAAEPAPEIEEDPDIGEHKDYDKEEAECYESGSIIVASQDGTKRGMEPYTMTLGTGCLEFYANELNQLKSDVGTKVNVYSMIAPTASELYCPSNERYLIDSQEEIIAEVRDMLVGVKQVDVLPTLKNHNAEDIYYRTDSRWTPLGAFYAGRVFAKAAGVPYADISRYTKTSTRDYTGDLLNLCGPQADTELRAAPDKFSYYEPAAKFTTNYYDEQFTFLSTDKFYFSDSDTDSSEDEDGYTYTTVSADPQQNYYKGGFYCLRIDTKADNGRKLIIIKDEYGTVMPTFLTSSFSQIYVVSYDYLEANLVEMIQDFGITDVLYLMNTFTITDTRVYTLETLRTQATHGSLEDNAPSETDSTDSDTSSDKRNGSDGGSSDGESQSNEPEYIYDVGINNHVGIVESSDEDAGSGYENGYENDYENDYDDGGNGYDDGGYDDGYNDEEEY